MSKKRLGKQFLTWLLAATMVMTLLPVGMLATDGEEGGEASAGNLKLTVGFKVRMKPKRGNQIDKVCNDMETLDVDPSIYSNVYIRPYLVVDGKEFEAPTHPRWGKICYTFEYGDYKNNAPVSGAGSPFNAGEKDYSVANAGNWNTANKIIIDDLSDERLNNGTPGEGDYYTLTVKAYELTMAGDLGSCLGTVTAKLHVRMTGLALPVLDWLESYTWDDDKYGIDRNLEKTYPTADDLIKEYLKSYKSTYGGDETFAKELRDIPVSWAVTDETEYSAAPGAVNSLTWTAELEKAPDYAKWTIPEGFECSRVIQFQNPFAVRFIDGENVHKTIHVKNGNTVAQEDHPTLPTKPHYTSAWDKEPGFTVEENTDVHTVYTPHLYGITYHLNGGTNSPDNPETYTVEDTFILKAPTKQGYAFTGWTYEELTKPQKSVTIPVGTTGELEFTALWRHTPNHPTQPEQPKVEDEEPIKLNTDDHFAYIVGYPDGTVQPSGQITRAEATTIFFRLLTDESREANFTKTNRYSDVAAGTWYNTAISTMTRAGIVDGYPDGTFRPDAPITRAEMSKIISLFAALDKKTDRFSDIAGHWAEKYIKLAAGNGWIEGYPDGTFLPQRNITRAETATMINRVLERVPSQESRLLDRAAMQTWPDANPGDWFYLAIQEATNSHDYERSEKWDAADEQWTALRANRDWKALEQ